MNLNRHFIIDQATLQEVANYITNNPSPNMAVGVAINLIGKLQQLRELPEATVKDLAKAILDTEVQVSPPSNGAQAHPE